MKGLKIERVHFNEPVDIRTKNSTRPERMVAYTRFELNMISTNWLEIISESGHRTLVPVHNIKSLFELVDESKETETVRS